MLQRQTFPSRPPQEVRAGRLAYGATRLPRLANSAAITELRTIAVRGVDHSPVHDLTAALRHATGFLHIALDGADISPAAARRLSEMDRAKERWIALQREVRTNREVGPRELDRTRAFFRRLSELAASLSKSAETDKSPCNSDRSDLHRLAISKLAQVQQIATAQYELLTSMTRPYAWNRVDVSELAASTTAAMAELRRATPVKWLVSADLPAVYGSPHLLQRALVECYSNADRVAQQRSKEDTQLGMQRFEVSVMPSTAGTVVFSCADTMGGFPQEFTAPGKVAGRQRAFDLDASTKGGGIGLCEVAIIAAAHGGNAYIESFPGRGSIVQISIGSVSRAIASKLPLER